MTGDGRSGSGGLLRSTLLVLGVRGVGIAAQLVLFVFATRVLSLADVGYFAAFTAVLMLSRVLGPLGCDISLMRQVASPSEGHRHSDALGLAIKAVPRVSIVSAVTGLILGALSGWAMKDISAALLCVVLLVSLPGVALSGLAVGVLRARGLVAGAQIPESMLQPVIALLVFSMLPLTGQQRSLEGLLVSQTAAVIVSLGWYLVLVVRGGTSHHSDADSARRFLRSSLIILRGAVWTAIGTRSATLLLLPIGGPASTALFEAGMKAQLVGTNVTWAVGLATAPDFARSFRSGDHHRLETLLARSTAMTLLPSTAVVLALLALGPEVMRVFGPSYQVGYPVALILASAALADASTGPIGYLYNMTGHERIVTRYNFYQMLVVLVGVPALAYPYGAIGAALAVLCGVVVRNLLLAVSLAPTMSVRPGVVCLASQGLGRWRRARGGRWRLR